MTPKKGKWLNASWKAPAGFVAASLGECGLDICLETADRCANLNVAVKFDVSSRPSDAVRLEVGQIAGEQGHHVVQHAM